MSAMAAVAAMLLGGLVVHMGELPLQRSNWDWPYPSDEHGSCIESTPQLSLSGLLRSSYKPLSGPPQEEGGDKEQGRKKYQERIGNLEPEAPEWRPELGSLLFGLLSIGLAYPVGGFGMDRWDDGRRVIGGLCIAFCMFLGLQAIVGVPFGLDMWTTLWRVWG